MADVDVVVAALNAALADGRIRDAGLICDKLKNGYPIMHERIKKTIDETYQKVMELRDAEARMDSSGAWDFYQFSEQVTVYTANGVGLGDHSDSMLFDAILDVPMYWLIIMFREITLYPKRFNVVREAGYLELGKDDSVSQSIWLGTRSPYPAIVNHRDAFLRMDCYDCLSDTQSNPAYYIFLKDIPLKNVPFVLQDESKRMDVHECLIRFRPLPTGAVRLTVLGTVDVQLRYFPHFLVNFLGMNVIMDAIKNFVDGAKDATRKNPDMYLQSRLEICSRFYARLKERIDHVYERLKR